MLSKVLTSLASLSLLTSAERDDKVSLKLPAGPFSVEEQLYQGRNGVVFLVKDSNGNKYDLKVLALRGKEAPKDKDSPEMKDQDEIMREFKKEQVLMKKVGGDTCPGIEEAKAGSNIECKTNHVMFSLGNDIKDLKFADNNKTVPLTTEVLMMVPKASNPELKRARRLLFGANILQKHMEGGRLVDLLNVKNKDTQLGNDITKRFSLFKKITPQIIDGLKYMHEKVHVAHLGLSTKTLLCSDKECKSLMISELGSSWNGRGAAKNMDNSEILQDSVRIPEAETVKDKNDERILLAQPALNLKTAAAVDWYAFGATLYNVVVGERPVVQKKHSSLASLSEALLQITRVATGVRSNNSNNLNVLASEVKEALSLVDGLMNVDRNNRVSFDVKTENSALLRKKNKVKNSFLELESEIDHRSPVSSFVGVSCPYYFNYSSNRKPISQFMGSVCM